MNKEPTSENKDRHENNDSEIDRGLKMIASFIVPQKQPTKSRVTKFVESPLYSYGIPIFAPIIFLIGYMFSLYAETNTSAKTLAIILFAIVLIVLIPYAIIESNYNSRYKKVEVNFKQIRKYFLNQQKNTKDIDKKLSNIINSTEEGKSSKNIIENLIYLENNTLYILKKGIKTIKAKEKKQLNFGRNLILPILLPVAIIVVIVSHPKQQQTIDDLNTIGQSVSSFLGISVVSFFSFFLVYLNNKESSLCIMCDEILDILEEAMRRKSN
jgi:ABC-type multidrug transport system fused ATPase/permease subunit